MKEENKDHVGEDGTFDIAEVEAIAEEVRLAAGEGARSLRSRLIAFFLRSGALFVVYVLAFLVAVPISAYLHLNTEIARGSARRTVNSYVSSLMMGRLEIRHIDYIGFDEIRARDISLYDLDEREVIHGDEATVVIDLGALLADGTLRFSHNELRGGHLWLYEGQSTLPSFLDAFEPSTPSDPNDTSPPFHAVVDDLHLSGITAEGTLLGLSGLRVEDLRVHGRMEFEEEVVISVFSADGRIVAPWDFDADLDALTARIDTEPYAGTRLHARVSTAQGEQAGVNLVYAVPEEVPADIADSTEPELDILVHADPIDAHRMYDLGFEWADMLYGETSGYFRLFGLPEDLAFRGHLETAGGPVSLSGRLPASGDVEVRGATSGLELSEVIRDAPEMEVVGQAGLRLEGEDSFVTANLEPFEIAGVVVPRSHIEGRLSENGVEVDNIRVTTPGGALNLDGNVSFGGDVDLRVDGVVGPIQHEPLLSSMLPDARGNLEANGRLQLSEEGVLNTQGRIVIRNFRYGPLFVRRLIGTGHVRGQLEDPSMNLVVDLAGTEVMEVPLGSGHGRVSGRLSNLAVRGEFDHPKQRLAFDGQVGVSDGVVRGNFPGVRLEGHNQSWRANLRGLRATERRLQVGQFSMVGSARGRGEQTSINASLDWGFARGTDDRFVAEIETLYLEDIRPWLAETVAIEEIGGVLTGRAEIRDDFEARPVINVDGHVASLAIYGVDDLEADFVASHSDGDVSVDARVHSEFAGNFDVALTGVVDRSIPLTESLIEGAYQATIEIDGGNLELLQAAGVEAAEGVSGRASGQIRGNGSYGFIDFSGELASDAIDFGIDGVPPIGANVRIGYEAGSLMIRGATRDGAGELLEGEVGVLLDLGAALSDPSLLMPMLEFAPWRAAIRFPPRDLATLPRGIVESHPLWEQLRASATLSVRGGAFRPVANLIGEVEWVGAMDNSFCGQDGMPRLRLRAALEDGKAEVEALGLVGQAPVLFFESRADAPLDEWVTGVSTPELPRTHANLYVQNVPLDELPYVCELAGGPLTLVLRTRDLFTEEMSAYLDIAAEETFVRRVAAVRNQGEEELQIQNQSPPIRLHIAASVEEGVARAEAESRLWNGGLLDASGELDLVFDENQLPSVDESSRLSARVNLDQTPLASVLFWLPSFSNVGGTANGEVSLSGTIGEPDFAGGIDVSGGQVELASLGQRLDNLRGTFLLEGDRITLQNVAARDGDGNMRIAGEILMDGFFPADLRLRLATDNFPVRQEGSIIASLTGSVDFDTRLTDAGIEGDLDVLELLVELPRDDSRSPIVLSYHPEIDVLGEEPEPPPVDPFELRLAVDATDPFRLEGEDIDASLSAELSVLYRDPEFLVSGGVELLDGQFAVFGRRFDVERGWIRFEGAQELDPLVNLVAVHQLRARAGESVTVTVTGRLSDPDVRFSSTITNDKAEIIALLVSGNVRQETADEAGRQATSFLNGVLSGALTLTLREEFGAYVPNFSVTSNSLGGNRIGTGWNFEQLLPQNVRDIILGMYVEGFINTGSGDQNTTSQVQDFGVRIELDFPRAVQTTGTYVAPAGWSLDVTWTP